MIRHVVPLFYPPDDPGVYVIVEAATGVLYRAQVGGHACAEMELEGFLVPCRPSTDGRSEALSEFFYSRFHGWPPQNGEWNKEDLQELATIVNTFLVGCSAANGYPYDHAQVSFDNERAAATEEGWIPVLTPWGRAVLAHENSD
jgi:hypothetical protein